MTSPTSETLTLNFKPEKENSLVFLKGENDVSIGSLLFSIQQDHDEMLSFE